MTSRILKPKSIACNALFCTGDIRKTDQIYGLISVGQKKQSGAALFDSDKESAILRADLTVFSDASPRAQKHNCRNSKWTRMQQLVAG